MSIVLECCEIAFKGLQPEIVERGFGKELKIHFNEINPDPVEIT